MPTIRVFALGGSILAPDRPDAAYAEAFAGVASEIVARGEHALIVTGGGGPARHYIKAARGLGVDEATLDHVGIAATRLNARFLLSILRHRLGPAVADAVPHTVRETADLGRRHAVAVMGGTVPGHSTDYVAAALAAEAGADHLYVLTNVDGVYTADPKKHPDAELLPELTTSRLMEIVGHAAWTAGMIGVVDPPCARLVHESRLPLTVLDGRDLAALRADLRGERGAGSVVHPDA